VKRNLTTITVLLSALLPAAVLGLAASSTYTEIRQYIKQSWTVLRRSNATLLKSAADSKVGQSGSVILYVPPSENLDSVKARLARELDAAELQKVKVLQLRQIGKDDVFSGVKEPGLLYLPKPYVVPGGRFNEMYGWDSFFILLGLVHDGELPLARDMTDNCLYEIEHYGKILNANRTYYLTRSQPPFLTRMILQVYTHTGNTAWLKDAFPEVERYYDYWTREPHLTPVTGLSRYYGGADTPAPEVISGERDSSGRNYYDRVRDYYRTHAVNEYDVSRYYDRTDNRPTPLFYVADRAMRESGFDVSGRFGPFSADILDYDPVDLNCLLYRMEMDSASICTLLDQPREARIWYERGQKRAEAINRLMWNGKSGLYYDYDFAEQRQSDYRFITTFYPLWAGIASAEQAARVAANLPLFERAGGLQTSDRVTGDQWDAPFGWAPMQIIATEGLRRYGFTEAADRISIKFLTMVMRDFARHGTIVEKYNVVTGRSDLAGEVKYGYRSNEIGFGWTNAAFVLLFEKLSPQAKADLVKSSVASAGSRNPALPLNRADVYPAVSTIPGRPR
jgi:alpha,alpha-trehalase